MIINSITSGIIAIIIGYLLGSIPSAYIIARLVKGKDIRKLGSGNVGANNVARELGKKAAIPVVIFDMGKGAAAVTIAHWLLNIPLHEPQFFILLTGIATVAGHIWPIYLKFTGGNGLSPIIGVLAIVMPRELLITIALIIILIVVTRNPILATNISLLSVPISAKFLGKELMYIGFCIILIIMLVLNFLPTAMAALAKAGGKEEFFTSLLRRDRH